MVKSGYIRIAMMSLSWLMLEGCEIQPTSRTSKNGASTNNSGTSSDSDPSKSGDDSDDKSSEKYTGPDDEGNDKDSNQDSDDSANLPNIPAENSSDLSPEPVNSALNCGLIQHGQRTSRIRYTKGFIIAGQSCSYIARSESGICQNGHIVWDSNTNLVDSCVEARIAYESSNPPTNEACKRQLQRRTCRNGQCDNWDKSYNVLKCTEEQTRYPRAFVPNGQLCEPRRAWRFCDGNGCAATWSGAGSTLTLTQCSVQGKASCGNTPHGETITRVRYLSNDCNVWGKSTASATCSNGNLIWDQTGTRFTFDKCEGSRIKYASAFEVAPNVCRGERQTNTCTDFSCTTWSGTYQHSTCQQVADASLADKGPILINEVDSMAQRFSSSQSSLDALEFVELYNSSNIPQSLQGYVLVLYSGNNAKSYDAIDLSGHSIPAKGYFVIGSPGVPNVNLQRPKKNSSDTSKIDAQSADPWIIVDPKMGHALVLLKNTTLNQYPPGSGLPNRDDPNIVDAFVLRGLGFEGDFNARLRDTLLGLQIVKSEPSDWNRSLGRTTDGEGGARNSKFLNWLSTTPGLSNNNSLVTDNRPIPEKFPLKLTVNDGNDFIARYQGGNFTIRVTAERLHKFGNTTLTLTSLEPLGLIIPSVNQNNIIVIPDGQQSATKTVVVQRGQSLNSNPNQLLYFHALSDNPYYLPGVGWVSFNYEN